MRSRRVLARNPSRRAGRHGGCRVARDAGVMTALVVPGSRGCGCGPACRALVTDKRLTGAVGSL